MIFLKSLAEIEHMRRVNLIVAEVLAKVAGRALPGVTLLELDHLAERIIRGHGALPTFMGYRGYPKTLCISVNDQVVHGIPTDRSLVEGDIVGIDCGVTLAGYVGDSALTVGVGCISPEAQKLLAVCREALFLGIEQVQAGHRLGDIGHAIQSYVESQGFSVVRDFVGHGIGKAMHEDPQVPNYGSPGQGARLQVGMVLALEPMVNQGRHEVRVLDDKWTVVTADGLLSAHFEHSVALTAKGPWVLSQPDSTPGVVERHLTTC